MTKPSDHGTMTIVMKQVISKSELKSQILAYLRHVESKKQPVIITHAGKPVVKIIPYEEKPLLSSLRSTVLLYQNPTEPVGEKDWEILK